MAERIILGIDPGSNITGYGVIVVKGNEAKLITAGVLDVSREADHFIKLQMVFRQVLELIDRHNPDELAIEEPFYGKNVQSMLKLGRAQGVAIAAALFRDMPVNGYSPRKIKMSVTGKGSASKEQVAEMVRNLLNIKEEIRFFDATDALAVALCHHFQSNITVVAGSKKVSGWKAFLQQNPERAV